MLLAYFLEAKKIFSSLDLQGSITSEILPSKKGAAIIL